MLKEKVIIEFQNKFNYDYFIETGTLQGEMVYKLNNYFKNLITIELDISQKLNHIILIDDARCFGNPDYPDYPNLNKTSTIITSIKPEYNFEVYGDIIRAYKKI